ncbi:hypothetical protein HDV05_004938 [Chytridiales sp. JEL 0842]|nr:hypothetical protein HDV05_004938 [Chytridiales sp. JEL 0842]
MMMPSDPSDPSASTSDAPTSTPTTPQLQTHVSGEYLQIRVHDPQQIDWSDSESTTSSVLDELTTLNMNLQDHRKALAAEMKSWEVRTLTAAPHEKLVIKPTASLMDHKVLHPAVYSYLKPVGETSSMEAIAILLGAPSDWADRFNQAFTSLVAQVFHTFLTMPPGTTSEAEIQAQFIGAVTHLGGMLGIGVRPTSKRKTIVGGFLAQSDLNVKSNKDPSFATLNKYPLLASEIKTAHTFPLNSIWYRKSRCVQTLSALYGLGAPVLLFTQQHWKLFVESSDRKSIHTYPFSENSAVSDHVNSATMAIMDGVNFAKVIAICLMAGAEREKELQNLQENLEALTLSPTLTPQKAPTTKLGLMSAQRDPSRCSARLALSAAKDVFRPNADDAVYDMPMPAFLSGFDSEGNPVYTAIRVMSDEEIEEIEREEAESKSGTLLQSSSADTLTEGV